jgi:hypothetical protein
MQLPPLLPPLLLLASLVLVVLLLLQPVLLLLLLLLMVVLVLAAGAWSAASSSAPARSSIQATCGAAVSTTGAHHVRFFAVEMVCYHLSKSQWSASVAAASDGKAGMSGHGVAWHVAASRQPNTLRHPVLQRFIR